jgi:hypothetical protein
LTNKLLVGSILVSLLTGVSAARAQSTKQVCIDASEKGQAMRDDHKLKAAREQFLLCARDVCPGPIKKDCADWLAGVDKAMPTVILVAKDNGQDVVKVGVDVDGTRVFEELNGSPMTLDPGKHSFRFTVADRPAVEEVVIVREGDRGRAIVVEVGVKPPSLGPAMPAAEVRPFHVPAPAWLLGGLTVAAGGTFAVLGITGKSDLSHLRDTCATTVKGCKQTQVDAVHNKLLGADIALYTGIATLAAATIITIVANKKSSSPPPIAGLSTPLALRF